MKVTFRNAFSTGILLLNLGLSAVFAGEQTPRATSPQTAKLQPCTDDKLGVRFLCNPDWELETQKNSMLIIVASDPAVTITVAKSDSPVVFVEQLSRGNLKEIGQYAEGFTMENIQFAGRPAIKVQATASDFPEIRILDYYVLQDLSLYSVLFSVNPKEKFDEYAVLFNKILESFEFLEKAGLSSQPPSIQEMMMGR